MITAAMIAMAGIVAVRAAVVIGTTVVIEVSGAVHFTNQLITKGLIVRVSKKRVEWPQSAMQGDD